MNEKVKLCRAIVKILLEITAVSGLLTLLVGSNIDLKQLLTAIAAISIVLAIIIDFVKGIEIDHFREEWAKN